MLLGVSQDLWQIKIPLKIKTFMWYLKKGVISTKDKTRMGIENVASVTLQNPYNIFFLDCVYSKFLWRAVHILLEFHPLGT